METMVIAVQSYDKFTQNEILQAIPENKRNEILKEKPLLKAYIVSQEGESKAIELNTTNQYISKQKSIMKWSKEAINNFFDKLKVGLKFFNNHNDDNSLDNRLSIGEVIGKTQKVIDGKLSNIIIGKFKELPKQLDTVSFEGILEYANNGIDKIVSKVVDITGIALASSKEVKPGFDSAYEIASVQFNETIENEITKQENTKKEEIKIMAININELSQKEVQEILDRASKFDIQKMIQYRKFTPSDLFDEKVLQPKIKVSKGKVSIDGDDENPVIEKLNEQIEKHYLSKVQELEKANLEFTSKLKSYENKERRPIFIKNFNEIIERKGLDEKTKKFMLKFVDKNLENKEIPDSEQGIYKMVDEIFQSLSDQYKEIVETLSIETGQNTKQDSTKQNVPIGSGTQKDALDLWLESGNNTNQTTNQTPIQDSKAV